jgi:hypothetical protein
MKYFKRLKKLKRKQLHKPSLLAGGMALFLLLALFVRIGTPGVAHAVYVGVSATYDAFYPGQYTHIYVYGTNADSCYVSYYYSWGSAPISGQSCGPSGCSIQASGNYVSAYVGPVNGPSSYYVGCLNSGPWNSGGNYYQLTIYPTARTPSTLNSFYASPSSIPYNSKATLYYSANRGSSGTGVYLSGYGYLPGWSGSIQQGPLATNTTYKVYLEDSYYGETGPWSAPVTVAAPPPPVAPTPSVSAAPATVDSGGTSALAWSAANVGAGQCSLTAPSSGSTATDFGAITTGSRVVNYYSVNAVVGDWAYSIGGYNGSAYVPTAYKAPASSDLAQSASWSTAGSIPTSVALFDEPLYINGNLWNFGGVAFNTSTWASTICYVPVGANGTLGSWSCPASLPAGAAQGYSNPVIIGDYIYRFGGYNYTTYAGPVAAVARAPLSSPGDWTNYTNVLPQAMYSQAVAVVGNYVYLFGGYSTTRLNTIYRASINSDLALPASWSSAGVIPVPLSSPGIAVDGSYLYIIGGYDNSGAAVRSIYNVPLNTLAAGGVTAGSWGSWLSLPVARNLPKPLIAGDKLYLMGGWQNGTYANAAYALPFNDGLPYTTPANLPWRVAGSPNSAVTWPLTANTTYTLQCTNPYGSNSDSATVTINDICTDIAGFQSTLPPGCTGPAPSPSGLCIPDGYMYNGSACVPAPPPPPSVQSFFGPGRVRSGNTAVLKYTVSNPPASCSITGTDGFTASVSPQDGVQGSVTTSPITANTVFTLTCDDASQTATVGITPEYQEI